jgi:DNA-binding MarR family transcriptional regulator
MKKGKNSQAFDRINPQFCINARLRRLHRMLNGVYQEQFRPYGLQGSMLSIMFIIGKRKNINQKTLSEMLVLDPSTMSRDLKKLSEKGWIAMDRGDDARHTDLSLTKEGYALLNEVAPVWEALHGKVEQLLGQFHLQQIDAITEALRTNLHALKH